MNNFDPSLLRYLKSPQAAIDAIDRLQCERSLKYFVKLHWYILEPSTPFVDGWALDAVCDHLEAVAYGEIQKILINVPPGFMKSLLTDVFFPAWEWFVLDQPHLRYVAFSYSASLTERDNRRFLDLIRHPHFQRLWGDKLSLRKQGETLVSNDKTGWKLATSIGGVGTGERGDRVILDDPHNVKESESDVVRKETVRWFREAMSNRLNNMEKSAIIVIMQRVHEEDVSGIILDIGDDYDHLLIQMEYEGQITPATSIGWTDPRNEVGELAWPSRFPRNAVEALKIMSGPYAYASQYQQTPAPRSGGIIKRDHWQLWGDEDHPENDRFRSFPMMDYILVSADTAYTEKEENDPSAIVVLGIFQDAASVTVPSRFGDDGDPTKRPIHRLMLNEYAVPRVMLMHCQTVRMGIDDLVATLAKTCRKFKANRLLIEAKASGISAAQMIERLHADENWGVELIEPKGDKVARVYSVEPIFAAGMVYAPYKVYDTVAGRWNVRQWAQEVIDEFLRFPKGAHEDRVDATTQALSWLRNAGMIRLGAELSDDIGMDTYNKGGRSTPLYPS